MAGDGRQTPGTPRLHGGRRAARYHASEPMSIQPPPDEPVTPAEDAAPAPADEPTTRRRWMPRRRPAAGPLPEATTPAPPTDGGTPPSAADEPLAEPVPVATPADGPRKLRRTRRRLLTRREEAVYHLGGLAFELYRRDMLAEHVMRVRAGEVAELDDTVRDIDVRLGEFDRERRERHLVEAPDPAVGCCLVCRTPFRAEARFCWQCGTQLVPTSYEGDEQATAVISATPAP